jgi:hypothetical protein
MFNQNIKYIRVIPNTPEPGKQGIHMGTMVA